MEQSSTNQYRVPHEVPPPPPVTSPPAQELGAREVPVVGAVEASLGLGGPVVVELDGEALRVQLGSGLAVRAEELPEVRLRRLRVDLVEGVVQSEAEGLGPCFDRALTIALCSTLRHALGWRPGEALLERGLGRLPAAGRGGERRLWRWGGFPRGSVAVHPEAALRLELRGDFAALELTRPLVLRVLGLALPVIALRWIFGEARVEVEGRAPGPVRRLLLRAAAWWATRRLRRALPRAMTEPRYDLFRDAERRAHLAALWRALRGRSEAPGPEGYGLEDRGGGAHARARERVGGPAGLFSAAKAALAGVLATLRVSADAPPPATRALARIPLGTLGAVALGVDRGDAVVLTKHPAGARVEAARGLYVYADQFPELAELRVMRVVARVDAEAELELDLQTDPPLGAFLRAVLRRASRRHLLPRVPRERLREAGVVPQAEPREHHVLWRQGLGGGRALVVRTAPGAEVELRHGEEALELRAPAGLEVCFEGIAVLPAAVLRRVAYRWADGALSVEGVPGLGEFGQALLSQLVRVRVAPRAPAGLGLRGEVGPAAEGELAARWPVALVDVRVPVLGALQLRMERDDVLSAELTPVGMALHSERGLVLTAPELATSIVLRGACHGLRHCVVAVDSSPAPGDYVLELAARCADHYLVPLVRRVVPLWPDARPEEAWSIGHPLAGALAGRLGFGFQVTLPPGGALIVRREPGALSARARPSLRVTPDEGAWLAELELRGLRWASGEGRIEIDAEPPAGPLLQAVARRLLERWTPRALRDAVIERLALPAAAPYAPPPAPPTLPLVSFEAPLLGAVCVVADREHALALELRRERARVEFGKGLALQVPGLGVHVTVRALEVEFLPFTARVECRPTAGELEQQLVGHALRGLFARVMPLFWPAERGARGEREVLLSLARGRSWGPIELSVGKGGALALTLDREGVSLRADAGAGLRGPGLSWLPGFTLHGFAYRFESGALRVRIAGVEERRYREVDAISPRTEALLAGLVRALVLPRAPAWAQRLGLRILPPLPEPLPEPTRVEVLRVALPGGHARLAVTVDPGDTFELRADREEVAVTSEHGLHVDAPGLHVRLAVDRARYAMRTGEVQIGELGQLENAFAEALLRRTLEAFEPRAAEADRSALASLLDRFPVEADGRRVLYRSNLVRVLLRPDTAVVVRLAPGGLRVRAEPPLELDGPAALDFRLGGLRYGFADAAFHLEMTGEGLVAGAFRGWVVDEVEAQLGSLLRPVLPAALRTAGYRLARDPNPGATVAALVRIVAVSGLLLSTRG